MNRLFSIQFIDKEIIEWVNRIALKQNNIGPIIICKRLFKEDVISLSLSSFYKRLKKQDFLKKIWMNGLIPSNLSKDKIKKMTKDKYRWTLSLENWQKEKISSKNLMNNRSFIQSSCPNIDEIFSYDEFTNNHSKNDWNYKFKTVIKEIEQIRVCLVLKNYDSNFTIRLSIIYLHIIRKNGKKIEDVFLLF